MKMIDLVAAFPSQLTKAIEIAKHAKLKETSHPIHNIFISGLGGSGIGGSVVKELTENESLVPITINKDYFVPNYVSKNTLAIICSYSGNTEETLNVLKLAIEKEAHIVCISSGGKISEIAKEKNFSLITIPGGMPPRSCIGYSITQIFKVFEFYKIIEPNALNEIEKSIVLLEKETENIKTIAKNAAEFLNNKLPVIYTLGNTEAVAIRFRQQINENAKVLCWHHVLPEMNHNELVGWTTENKNLAVIVFRYSSDYYRTVKRLEICKEVFLKYTPNYLELNCLGHTEIQRTMYAIHLGDWISCYLSNIRNVDASEIRVIDFLKSSLEKI
jgi:glucose/mannose-6-phosphate isomerase